MNQYTFISIIQGEKHPFLGGGKSPFKRVFFPHYFILHLLPAIIEYASIEPNIKLANIFTI
jgi:hypothetical protein